MRKTAMIAALSLVATASSSALAGPVEAGGAGQITAIARSTQHHGWLDVRQMDTSGAYEARVSFADLDLAEPDGWSAATARIEHAAADVCRMLGSDPEMPDIAAVDQRGCIRSVHADLARRLDTARAEARAREGMLARR